MLRPRRWPPAHPEASPHIEAKFAHGTGSRPAPPLRFAPAHTHAGQRGGAHAGTEFRKLLTRRQNESHGGPRRPCAGCGRGEISGPINSIAFALVLASAGETCLVRGAASTAGKALTPGRVVIDTRTMLPVMPTKVGIHAFSLWRAGQSWMPTFVGMTGWTPAVYQPFRGLVLSTSFVASGQDTAALPGARAQRPAKTGTRATSHAQIRRNKPNQTRRR